MTATALKNRLNRAISKLPPRPPPLTTETIRAQLAALGIDFDDHSNWLEANPNETEIEMVIRVGSSITLPGRPKIQWTEGQAIRFLQWRDENMSIRYYRG